MHKTPDQEVGDHDEEYAQSEMFTIRLFSHLHSTRLPPFLMPQYLQSIHNSKDGFNESSNHINPVQKSSISVTLSYPWPLQLRDTACRYRTTLDPLRVQDFGLFYFSRIQSSIASIWPYQLGIRCRSGACFITAMKLASWWEARASLWHLWSPTGVTQFFVCNYSIHKSPISLSMWVVCPKPGAMMHFLMIRQVSGSKLSVTFRRW